MFFKKLSTKGREYIIQLDAEKMKYQVLDFAAKAKEILNNLKNKTRDNTK